VHQVERHLNLTEPLGVHPGVVVYPCQFLHCAGLRANKKADFSYLLVDARRELRFDPPGFVSTDSECHTLQDFGNFPFLQKSKEKKEYFVL